MGVGKGAQMDTSKRTGDRVGRYELGAPLGRGGMGVVFRAHDPKLDREVALKLLRPGNVGSASTGPAQARLLREARAMAQLSHPNIAAIFDVGHEGETVYLAMEVVEGRTLKEWLAAGPHPLSEIASVLGQAARGLAAAHAAGLVHRDFKPSNVIVGDDGRVRVLDFGLAATVSEVSAHGDATRSPSPSQDGLRDSSGSLDRLTMTGVVMGTPAYMAPEQHGGAAPDARSDQFSFAVVLFEALYGRRPYAKTGKEGVDAAIVGGQLPEPKTDRPPPRAVARAMVRALSKNPADRFDTMQPLVEVLAGRGAESGAGKRMFAALAAGAAVIGALAVASARPADSCRDQAQAAATALWGPSREDALTAAFDNPEVPYARATWDRIRPRLSAYVEQWSRARLDACQAEVATTSPRARCLQQRRDAVDDLLALLRQGQPQTLRRAAALTADLPAVADCERPDAGSELDPVATDEVAELLRRSRLHEAAGDLDTAAALADDAVAKADGRGSEALQADAAYRRGRVHMARDEYEAARDELTRAYHLAATAKYDEGMVLAATDLIEVYAGMLRDEDKAREWLRHAEAATARVDGDELMRARLLNNVGLFHTKFGRFEEAAEVTRRALGIRAEYLPPQHPDRIDALGNLAAIEIERGHFDEAMALQRTVIDARRALHGDDHPEVASALSNYGAAFFEQRQLDRAREIDEEALAMRRRVLPPGHLDIALSLVNLGAVVGEQGDYVRARELYEQARQIREAALPEDHPDLISTWGDLGIAYSRAGEYDKARTYVRRAIEGTSAALGPDHPELGRTWGNLGVIEQLDGNLEGADEAYGNALRIFEAKLGPDSLYTAYVLNNLAAVKLKRDRPDEALPLYERALAVQRKGQSPENSTLSVILTGLGRAQHGLGKTADAVATLQEARAVADRTGLEPRLAVETYLALAMAQWDRNLDDDRRVARELADAASDKAEVLGPAEADLVEQVDQWRRAHVARG